MTVIDEEMQIQIQSFTSWASERGYHVIGAFIGPKGVPKVRIFATTPESDLEAQKGHVEKLLKIVNHAMRDGQSAGQLNLPLGTN